MGGIFSSTTKIAKNTKYKKIFVTFVSFVAFVMIRLSLPHFRRGASRGAALKYWTGHGAGRPSSCAACSGQYGSRSSSRAMSTQSASPF
jgi:hypothetical protein